MIQDLIIRTYQEKFKRKWDILYFAIDLHGTIIRRYTGKKLDIYKYATETLQYLSSKSDIVLILFTSTYPKDLIPFYSWCKDCNISFKYLNENPECQNNKTGDFSKKFYYNVLLDDRAGFNPNIDWVKTLIPEEEANKQSLKKYQ